MASHSGRPRKVFTPPARILRASRSAHIPAVSLKVAVYRSGRFSHFLKRSKAERKVRAGGFTWRGDNTLIEEVDPAAAIVAQSRLLAVDAIFGAGNMVPFSRALHPLKRPPRLHYQIPAVGAHGRLLRCSDVNHAAEDGEVVAVAS